MNKSGESDDMKPTFNNMAGSGDKLQMGATSTSKSDSGVNPQGGTTPLEARDLGFSEEGANETAPVGAREALGAAQSARPSAVFVSGDVIFQEMEYSDAFIAQRYIKNLARDLAESLLVEMIDVEAHAICGVGRHVRGTARQDWRISSYIRNIRTSVGTLTLRIPIFKHLTLPKVVIENYCAKEEQINKSLARMLLGGASAIQLTEIVLCIWGDREVPTSINMLGRDMAWKIEVMRNTPLPDIQPRERLHFVAFNMPGSTIGVEAESVCIYAAMEMVTPMHRKVISLAVGSDANPKQWATFCDCLAVRGLLGAIAQPFPQ